LSRRLGGLRLASGGVWRRVGAVEEHEGLDAVIGLPEIARICRFGRSMRAWTSANSRERAMFSPTFLSLQKSELSPHPRALRIEQRLALNAGGPALAQNLDLEAA